MEVFQSGIPNVAVHDLVIQPEAKDLVVGTHGRSIYKTNIALLQKTNTNLFENDLMTFSVDPIKHSKRWGTSWSSWLQPQTPGLAIPFYIKNAQNVAASIQTKDGVEVSSTELKAEKGFNRLDYDVAFSKEGLRNFLRKNKMNLKAATNGKTYLPKGSYTVFLKTSNSEKTVDFSIE